MTERFGEREVGVESARRVYVLRADSTETIEDAWDYVLSNAATITGLVINDVNVREIRPDEIFQAEVSWGTRDVPDRPAVGDIRVSSRTSLQPVRVKYSIDTPGEYPASWFDGAGTGAGSIADFNGQIGIDAEGEVQGVDVLMPVNVLSVEKIIPTATVSEAYQYATEQIVGCVNSLEYRSRAAGTLLCSGVTWNQVDSENFSVSAEFMFEPNQSSLTIGGITGVAKDGWEYLWAYNVKKEVDGRSQPVAAQVNVEQVYQTADFYSVLGF